MLLSALLESIYMLCTSRIFDETHQKIKY